MVGQYLWRTGRTGLEGTGSVFRASCKAYGGSRSSENRAHLPGGYGEPSQGGVRSLLQGQRGAILFREPGAPTWGGRGAQPSGWLKNPAMPIGGHHPSRLPNPAPTLLCSKAVGRQ